MNQPHSSTFSTIRIEIEAETAYEQSLLWTLHRDYYQQAGLEAFLKQEVPYNISSNPCLASQAVQLLLASLPAQQAAQLPNRISILELGAGSGIFAYNFLTTLNQQAPELLPQIDYWLSDYAPSTLKALAAHPAFKPWLDQGVLRLACIDGEQPQLAQDLSGQTVDMPESGFQLIIANYFFSTLPTAVLMKQQSQEQEQWLHQTTRLDWLPLGEQPTPDQITAFCAQIAKELRAYRLLDHIGPDHPQHNMFRALQQAQDSVADTLDSQLPPLDQDFRSWLEESLAQTWAQALGVENGQNLLATVSALLTTPLFKQQNYLRDQVRPEHRFSPVKPDELFGSELHRQAIDSLISGWPQASLGYSAVGLETLSAMVKLTCPQGIVLVSDKAYASAEWMRGLNPESATRHGQSLAHPVNFPLFEAFMQVQGLSVCRTQDPAQALHSLMVYYGSEIPTKLTETFTQDFIDYPRNELSHSLLEGGHALMQAERLEEASRSLQRALNYRPSDGTLQYLLAVCLLNQERYSEAVQWLEKPHDDLYGLFNREILLAESWRLGGHPERALDAYRASLRHGENSQTYYNLALCQIELGQTAQARESLQRAATLDPNDTDIETLLADLPGSNGHS